MRIDFLQTLIAVHRFGSFSTAAQSRNMTLSALSMQMKTLEEDLGVALFDRAFRPPKLTPIGEQVALDAQAVIEAEARLRSRCSDVDSLTGHFHIGFVTSVAARSLSEFLRQAATRAPKARFTFETGLSETLCESVRAGRLDAAIVTDIRDATAGLNTTPVSTEEMVLVAPPGADQVDHGAMAAYLPFFHFMPNSGIGRLIAGYCKSSDMTPIRSIYLDNIEAIVNCVADGLGFSLLPKHEVRRYGAGRVRYISCAPDPFFRTISLVGRPDPLSMIWRAELSALARAGLSGG